ncbi:pleckstrin homology domain-containing family H member 3 [Takifugu rubripes]|uniref:pleckstrin homology domain-containing family H member 3 n=1 Tax=Takifugu rubripes TaxID=31033 RepID=UPI0005D1B03C|nr:pleckstrin homology domain-containing family H member 3 [Takifugu rubripes]|eukprot:XP_011602453.1 PREDICTED: pleckstrin homology domain-containing family H member 3 isoform X1 [Takifugu rubripes]
MPLHAVCWFLCCRQGFSLLGRDYGEKEEEESFELRNKEDLTPSGRSPAEVTVCQPTHTANGSKGHTISEVSEEMKSLVIEKSKMGLDEEPELLVKGWLLLEVRGNWIKQRRYWFVLSQDSLDYYSGSEKGARRLGTLVLTSLCSVIWPDKQKYKETGFWNITVYGRKHCYRLYTKHFNEAVHWACAIQKIIDTKAPVETPTQLLIRDIEENKFHPEVVEHIYQHNPILKYTQGPLYAPLLPFPYGSLEHTYHSGKGYGSVREEAVKLFNCLQQLESSREPVPIIQGVLQTCLDLRPLRDEVYCQLVKQTSYTPAPYTAAHLRYWQLLTCMSCTFLPGPNVLKYLRFHLKRIQSQNPESEMDNYASFINEALDKTKCRECVPCWEEIQTLMNRQKMLCTVHYPGPGSCQLYISSHTTANEVVRRMQEKLGLQDSNNTFALYKQSSVWEQPVAGSALIADVLTSLASKESEAKSQWKLCFKLYCLMDTDSISVDSIEYLFLFEQCHEMVVRGQLPGCEEDLQTLAALRLQFLMGDFSTHAPCPPLEELFPNHMLEARVLVSLSSAQALSPCQVAAQGCHSTQRFTSGLLAGALWSHAATAAHKQKLKQDIHLRSRLKEEAAAVMGVILERWRGLVGYGCRDSIAAYLAIARQWSGFGCTLYEVDFYISSTGSFSQKLWLGVAATSVSLYRQGEAEALESFPYGQICSYGVSDSNTFRITAGDRDLLFETTKLAEIMQLMNAYFSAIRCPQGKGEDVDITKAESTEVGLKHLASTLTPTLLELPSHPV